MVAARLVAALERKDRSPIPQKRMKEGQSCSGQQQQVELCGIGSWNISSSGCNIKCSSLNVSKGEAAPTEKVAFYCRCLAEVVEKVALFHWVLAEVVEKVAFHWCLAEVVGKVAFHCSCLAEVVEKVVFHWCLAEVVKKVAWQK